MKRVLLTLALVLVLGSATLVRADYLQEPAIPPGGASEGDLMTISAPGNVDIIGKAFIAGLLTMSFYR